MKALLIIWAILLVLVGTTISTIFLIKNLDADSEIKELQAEKLIKEIEKLNKEIKEMSVTIELPEPPDVNDYMRDLENDLKLGGTISGGGGSGGTGKNTEEADDADKINDANIDKAELEARIKILEEKMKKLEAFREKMQSSERKKSQDENSPQD